MKTKYLWRNLFREIARTLTRFLSIFAISAIGVSFFTGVRASGPDMKLTADAYLDRTQLADITALSTAGLSEDDMDTIRAIPGVAMAEPALATDAMMRAGDAEGKEFNMHLLSMPFQEVEEHPAKLSILPDYGIDPSGARINQLDVVAGRLPADDHEIALDARLAGRQELAIGTKVTLTTLGGAAEVYVTGFVESPRYISNFDRGTSTVGNGSTDAFAYVSGNVIGKLGLRLPMMAMFATRYSEVLIRVSGAEELNCFSDEYDRLVDEVVRRIEAYGKTTDATWYVRTRTDNPGYLDYSENTERIAAVGTYFPLIFLLVALLVALTTMTRMVEEQRIQMGTLKALGYSQYHIVMQYLMYAILASLTGSLIGARIGFWLFPTVIGNSYGIMYRLPNLQTPCWPGIATASILAVVGCVTAAAALVSFSALHEVPASLMRPKAPKIGKRVFLEYIGFIWKRMSFTSKVTVRNLFRYKKRFFMSVIGIAGSCGLLVTGFGLSDSIFGIVTEQFGRLWTMDIQAYTYDAMSEEKLHALVAEADGGLLTNAAYCYDRAVSAGVSGNVHTDAHLFVASDAAALQKTVHLTGEDGQPVDLTDDGVVVTQKLASIYRLRPGDTIAIESGDETYEAPIAAIAENYVYHYVYFTPACYERVTGDRAEYNAVFANIEGFSEASETEQAEIEETLAKSFLQDERVYSVKFLTDLYSSVWDSLSVLNYVVGILILSAAALAFVVMLNLTNINITERRRELATLKVLGFTDREMYDYIFRENNALAVIGTLAGLLLGKYLHRFVIVTCEVDMVMFVRQIKALSFVYSGVLSMAFALIVNILMRKKVRGVDMVESMKSAE